MDFTKKQLLVVYIDSHGAYFYADSLGRVLQLNFPQDVVSDMDIVGREKFENLLNSFIQTNFKGLDFSVILVFSQNTLFEKEIVPVVGKEIEDLVQEFIGAVPFEEVLSKTYKLNKKTKVAAVNRAFYDLLRNIFEMNKQTITMVLPLPILQIVNPDLANRMDLSLIAQKADSLRQFNMIEAYQGEYTPEQKNTKEPKKINKRLLSLIGVFVFLLLALFVFAYMSLFQQKAPTEADLIKAFTPTPTVQINEALEDVPLEETQTEGSISATPTLQNTGSAN